MPAKKAGRPLLAIDEGQVYRLAKSGCTDTEIADFFDCAHTTISRRFAQTLAKARAATKRRLRRKQIELALRGDRTMLIWLGKQMLGQSDSPAVAIQNNVQNNGRSTPAKRRTQEEDEAFLRLAEKVRRQMKPPGQDLLGGSQMDQ